MALIHLDFHSDVLRRAVNATVILPQAAASQIGMEGKRADTFPTLYLLHGLSDDHTIWSRRTSVERYAARYGVAVVMPNGDRSWYTDMAHGAAYYTYVAEELPRVMRSFFAGMSDRREGNYIAGLSMGGYGAWKIGMRNPDRFAGIASFSGALDVANSHHIYDNPAYWTDIFGPFDGIAGSDNDAYAVTGRALSSGAPLPRLYLSCGTEDALLPCTRRMKELLDAHHVPVAYREAPGHHNWEFWDDEIERAMAFFFGN